MHRLAVLSIAWLITSLPAMADVLTKGVPVEQATVAMQAAGYAKTTLAMDTDAVKKVDPLKSAVRSLEMENGDAIRSVEGSGLLLSILDWFAEPEITLSSSG